MMVENINCSKNDILQTDLQGKQKIRAQSYKSL